MKKVNLQCLVIAFAFIGLSANVSAQIATSFAGGNGSQSNPYQIANGDQLRLLSNKLMQGDGAYNSAYYVLTADIDLGGFIYDWSGSYNSSNYSYPSSDGVNESNFLPIGGYNSLTSNSTNAANTFSGKFDGQNHTITGLVCKKSTSTTTNNNNVGLFGRTYGAIIKNVRMSNCSFSGQSNVGAIVGIMSSSDTVINCHINDVAIHGNAYTGGMVGNASGVSSSSLTLFYMCSVDNAEITNNSANYLGGMIGYGRFNYIDSCNVNHSNVKMYNGSYVGGFLGYNEQSFINKSVVANTDILVNDGSARIGGMIGYNYNFSYLFDCYTNNVNVVTHDCQSVGGFIGMIEKNCLLKRCYSQNATVSSDKQYLGGMIGRAYDNCNMDSCYSSYMNVINIGGENYLGGLIGKMDDYCSVANCFAVRCDVLSGSLTNPNTSSNWAGGMIGWSEDHCLISQCYATYCNVHAGHDVGGLIGDPGDGSTSVYEKCYSTNCTLYGTDYVGGLFGGGNASYTIKNCYSTLCSISASGYAGGLIGYGGSCYIQNSYATNVITRRNGHANSGGLTAYQDAASRVTNSYYINTYQGNATPWTPAANASRGIAKTSAEMLDTAFVTTLNNGQNPQVWFQDTTLYVNGGYPVLEISRGREGVTYQIWNVDDMRKLSQMIYDGAETYGRFYSLMSNIDFNNAPAVAGLYDINYQLRPIGYRDNLIDNPFCGRFDGNNFRISNLRIIKPSASFMGLFGHVGGGAYIRNVAVYDSRIQGDTCVGGIVGYANPIRVASAPENISGRGNVNIVNSYVRVNVDGNNKVGGFVGSARGNVANNNAITVINNCYSRSNVLNNDHTKILGGFVGYAENSSVSNCYSTGSVSTDKFLGSAGSNITFSNTYALGYGANAISKTKTDMKDAAFVTTLGGSPNWFMDTSPWTRNNGYPILGYEPVSDSLCIIEDEQTITVSNSVADFNSRPSHIIIEDGGSLINNYTSGQFTNVTVERNLLNEQYVFIGTAFGKVTTGNYLGEHGKQVYDNIFDHSPVSVLAFNYGTNMWLGDPGGYTYLGYNSNMLPCNGYFAYVLDPNYVNSPQWLQINQGTLVKQSFNDGALWNKDTTISVYNGGTPHTIESNTDGIWYALSNPFSANLWVRPFLNTNTNAQGDVLYSLAADRTWNVLQKSDLDARVKIGEGFFIASKDGITQRTQQFAFNRDHMTKATSKDMIIQTQIKLTAKVDNRFAKEAYITINEISDNGFDNLDAYKMFGQNNNFVEPYFMVMNNSLVINAIKDLPYETGLNFSAAANKEVELTFEGIPNIYWVTFSDLASGTIDTISEGHTLQLSLLQGQNKDRFIISISKNLNFLDSTEKEMNLNLWANNNRLTIKGNDLQMLEVYNTLGQIVFSTELSGNAFSTILNLKYGSYIAKVKSATGQKVIKFVINF